MSSFVSLSCLFTSDQKKIARIMVRSGAGVIANISVQLNQPEKHQTKFCLSRVLLK
jgi:hypothetical protein